MVFRALSARLRKFRVLPSPSLRNLLCRCVAIPLLMMVHGMMLLA